jgi:hypothetical protein
MILGSEVKAYLGGKCRADQGSESLTQYGSGQGTIT